MAPNQFSTYEVVPAWSCCKLIDDEDFETYSTIPLVFATAIHALLDIARLEKGESVLIHSAAGGVGLAAIQIAKLVGAEIFATVSTEAKREFLINEFGLRTDHILDSHGSGFLPVVMEATAGKGVDVILNSLSRDQLHAGFSALAELGRFVDIGKKDIVDGWRLDMGVFNRSATFAAFDLSSFFNSEKEAHRMKWNKLLFQTMEMFRSKKLKPIHPLKVFDVSDIGQAYRYLSLRTRIGKIAVSMQNPESQIDLVH
jgi:NADPH:quinone reductase-like Zn-dependent oxidoreductase